jgi:uncharacterized protein (DUF736 family)
MIIGTFSYDPEHDIYSGEITTLTLQRTNVSLCPTHKSGEKEPDYRIVQDRDGGTVEFGAAWKRSSERGRAFLSIVLDDPALSSLLNVALFPSERDDTATLVWQRPVRRAPAAEADPATTRSRRPAAQRHPAPG